MDNWQITYPDGLVRYVDFFRSKNFQYEMYDKIVIEYLEAHSKIKVKSMCSLGCGTGRHEVQLVNMGYDVIGVERNNESVPILTRLFDESAAKPIELVKADFFDENALKVAFGDRKFDCILLLFIPLSIPDVLRLVQLFEPYLKDGGLMLTNQFFGYEEGFVPNRTLSDCDCAEDPFDLLAHATNPAFCARINVYQYRESLIDWNAIYIYNDETNTLRMRRDHDIIEVLRYDTYEETLRLPERSKMKLLPLREVSECSDEMNMPKTKDYIVAWRKLDE